MTDNIFLPNPGPDGWSQEYLTIIRKAADQIIENPMKTYSEERALWERMTEAERDSTFAILKPAFLMLKEAGRRDRVEKSPQSYLDQKIATRRFGWLRRWVNEWVLWQREVGT